MQTCIFRLSGDVELTPNDELEVQPFSARPHWTIWCLGKKKKKKKKESWIGDTLAEKAQQQQEQWCSARRSHVCGPTVSLLSGGGRNKSGLLRPSRRLKPAQFRFRLLFICSCLGDKVARINVALRRWCQSKPTCDKKNKQTLVSCIHVNSRAEFSGNLYLWKSLVLVSWKSVCVHCIKEKATFIKKKKKYQRPRGQGLRAAFFSLCDG